MKQDETALHGRESLINNPLPVLFTCPHGGRVEFSPSREASNVNCGRGQFRIKSDTNTIEVTEGIALNILRMSRRDVYRTVAIADRSFIDFNREPECAYVPSSDHFAKDLYDGYHKEISNTIEKMHSQNNQGFRFLFDFHGTDNTEAQLFFGTDARTNPHKSTICGLLERNAKALWDDTGLLRLLQDKGYSTIPRNIDDSEHQSFDGGLTVTKYGGCDVNQRVEAIQCEIAADLRERSNRLKFTVDMAECILKFVRPYISQI
jgi:N-formylglutamate amidohydrolase